MKKKRGASLYVDIVYDANTANLEEISDQLGEQMAKLIANGAISVKGMEEFLSVYPVFED